jgi:hypothetical protein
MGNRDRGLSALDLLLFALGFRWAVRREQKKARRAAVMLDAHR